MAIWRIQYRGLTFVVAPLGPPGRPNIWDAALPYQSYYQALFARPLIQQVIAIIQRDQYSALAIVNAQRALLGNYALKSIREFHMGPGYRTSMPWLTVVWDSTVFRQEEELLRASAVNVSLALDVGQFDQEMIVADALDYAWMLDIVVKTAFQAMFQASWEIALPIEHPTIPAGMTVPSSLGTIKNIIVTEHRPGVINVPEIPAPVMRVTLPLLVELKESTPAGAV